MYKLCKVTCSVLKKFGLVMVELLFLAVPWGCLQFVIVVFPDHTHYFCVGREHKPMITIATRGKTSDHILRSYILIFVFQVTCYFPDH